MQNEILLMAPHAHLYILAFNLKRLSHTTTLAFMLFLDISLGLVGQEANL